MLFDRLAIRSVQFKNRIAISPMCQYSSIQMDSHLAHLGHVQWVEQRWLFRRQRPSRNAEESHPMIWVCGQIEPLQKITNFIKKQGSVAGIQLAHAAEKAGGHAFHPGKVAGAWKNQMAAGISRLIPRFLIMTNINSPEAMSKEDIINAERLLNPRQSVRLEAVSKVVEYMERTVI